MASRWHILLGRLGQRHRVLLPVVKSCRSDIASSICPPTAIVHHQFLSDLITPSKANESGGSKLVRDQVYQLTLLFGKLLKSGEDKKAAELLDGITSLQNPAAVAVCNYLLNSCPKSRNREGGLGRGTTMASKTLVALLAWSLVCGPVVQARVQAQVQAQNGFDFFYFVQQWPGSYCDTSQGCCFPLNGPPKAVFGIHGLWPNNKDGSYPSNCGSTPYDPTQIKDILKSMNADWGSLACPSSDSGQFWSHEWTKHGTCSGMNEHAFFKSAISLYGTYDITGALKKAGIVPDGSEYNVDDMAKAMSTVLNGHLPGVECNSDQQGNQQLYQVYICVAKDGSTLIDCPVLPSNECTGTVAFPVFNPNGGAV